MSDHYFHLFVQTPAFLAYIDPNTGGLLMQYLLPVFVAIGAAWSFLRIGCLTRLCASSTGSDERNRRKP
jgi:hypothetical protein